MSITRRHFLQLTAATLALSAAPRSFVIFYSNNIRDIFRQFLQSAMVAASLFFALPHAALSSEQSDFLSILSGDQNYLRRCEIIIRSDGAHLVITMAKQNAGDALHIENDQDGTSYDYIFGAATPTRVVFQELKSLAQFDIPMRTALGLRGSKRSRIFRARGSYTIYVGYGFRANDEAEIYGACRVIYQP